jgi:hypothetical protein
MNGPASLSLAATTWPASAPSKRCWALANGRRGLRPEERSGGLSGHPHSRVGQAARAHYGEFVQLERLKKNGRFGGKRTAGLVMPNGAVSAMPCEAMLLSMVVWLG